jgi:dienelactone hydrolase
MLTTASPARINTSMRILAVLLLSTGLCLAQQAPLARADPNAPENAARTALSHSLDELAARQTAARRAEIARIHTRAEAKARQEKVRATMLRLLGPLPERTPLNPQMLGETQLDGFRIQKVLFDSQPGFHVTALLFLPDVAAGTRLPAIVMAPGHGATGKAGDFALAGVFARNGFAVLSYDPIGQGERLQYPDPKDPTKSLATRPTGEHAEASLQPMLIGESVAKYFLWDGVRAVDYLQTRAEIDPNRIGAFGCSGGGAMTALLGALDPRVAAIGTACYITSFDTLLPAIGPQDGEQSTPGWIAAGLDFPDWVELAAPRPYAIIATASDMFPYAGARSSAAEARRFYALFNPISAGVGKDGKGEDKGKELSSFAEGGGPASVLPIPTAPTLNPDTANTVSPSAPLQFIVGPGGHGNLRPLQEDILRFFMVHLAHSNAEPKLQPPSPAPAGALQVTSTGQVSTAYPGSSTVFSLNLAHFKTFPPPHPLVFTQLQQVVTQVAAISAKPGEYERDIDDGGELISSGGVTLTNPFFESEPGIGFGIHVAAPESARHNPAHIVINEAYMSDAQRVTANDNAVFDVTSHYTAAGALVLITPTRPSRIGSEEQKSPILGGFYLLTLRANLVGKTLLGMRIDDVLREVDSLCRRADVDPNNITAEASGHDALVLLHAAVLDQRLKHITVKNLLPSYRDLIANPLPKDVAEDILPGVLQHYDIPDLIRALGDRVTVVPPGNSAPAP